MAAVLASVVAVVARFPGVVTVLLRRPDLFDSDSDFVTLVAVLLLSAAVPVAVLLNKKTSIDRICL